MTWVTLTEEGVPGVVTTAASRPSSAESGNLVARADLGGETLTLGEAGAGEAEREGFVTDADLGHNVDK